MTKNASQWFLYIIETKKKRLYTGITTDINRRYAQHCGELAGGAKFFRSDKPKSIVHQEKFPNRSAASKREAEIKKLSAKEKRALISH